MVLATYGELASEYYDARRHPTCANFRQASQLLLSLLVPEPPVARYCEVGAGSSLLAELLWRRHCNLEGLLITDAQPEMLEHSRHWEPRGAALAVATAAALPVPDSSLDLVVGCLVDPYDDHSFWEEVLRVLSPGGKCVITTPSSLWAHRFRVEGSPDDAAEFVLEDETTVYVTSFVRSPEEERLMIESHGLTVTTEASATLDDLEDPISPKLRVLEPKDTVVQGFVVAGRD
jgi:SAM-dependent methyltransferase